MRPAFASTGQAAAFALLLLVLLLSPLILGKRNLPPREQIYSSIWWANGAFPYIDQQIFDEKGNIDIAFVGPSHIWNGINTRYVQEELSKKLGRQAVVRTFGWGGAGYDALYFITQDLLQHRKVHLLVFYDATNDQNQANALIPRWFRWGDDAGELIGLPIQIKANYYFATVIGMPRVLLELLRSNFPVDLFSSKPSYWEIHEHAENFSVTLGSLVTRRGYGINAYSDHAPFEDYVPPVSAAASDVVIYSPGTKRSFEFTGGVVPSWQLHFARKFADLSESYGCKLVLLHMPVMSEMKSPVIQEKEFWPDALHADVTMIGIPPDKLFAGMGDEEVRKLFEDPVHLSKNGQAYFTSLITPRLLELYDASTSR